MDLTHNRMLQKTTNFNIIKKYTLKGGFTLVELLVVISVIFFLATVVLGSLQSAGSKGRDAKRISDLQSVAGALELYYQDNGSYPPGNCISSPWWGCWGSTNGQQGSTELRLLPATYIPRMPQDPTFYDNGFVCTYNPGNNQRSYMYYSDGQNYILSTNLENAVLPSNPHYYDNPNFNYGCTDSGNWAIRGGSF
jgi:prepilin-type N-terminal cleavage/methylation domain-containing protein